MSEKIHTEFLTFSLKSILYFEVLSLSIGVVHGQRVTDSGDRPHDQAEFHV